MSKKFGPYTAVVEAEIARVQLLSLLSPDSSMESQDESAVQWLNTRADEFVGGLSSGELQAGVIVQRSLVEAFALRKKAWHSVVGKTKDEVPLRKALAAARSRSAINSDSEQQVREQLEFSGYAASRAVARVVERAERWRSNIEHYRQTSYRIPLDPFLSKHGSPLLGVVSFHFAWMVLFGRAETAPSPAEPLLAMWERGVWPMPLPNGNLLVYLPLWDGDKLVLAAEGTAVADLLVSLHENVMDFDPLLGDRWTPILNALGPLSPPSLSE